VNDKSSLLPWLRFPGRSDRYRRSPPQALEDLVRISGSASDGEGQPIRVLFQGRYTGTITNSVTGASLVDSPSVANITFDLIDGTQTNVGAFFNITVLG